MKKTYIGIISLVAVVAVFAFCLSPFAVKHLFLYVIEKELNADVAIKSASFSIRKVGFEANGVTVRNLKGLDCSIGRAVIRPDIFDLFKQVANFDFELQRVRLSHPASKVIGGIYQALSITERDSLNFDEASGRFYSRGNEMAFKSVNASGSDIKLFADGTVIRDKSLNCTFKISLSGGLINGIPETTQKLFFKQDGSWATVDLYLSGDINNPSINFSTPKFKLVIR